MEIADVLPVLDGAYANPSASHPRGRAARRAIEDARETVAWYRRAAEQGYAGAQFNLGVCYEDGAGVAADARVAAEWLERAAASGDAGVAERARAALAKLRARDPP